MFPITIITIYCTGYRDPLSTTKGNYANGKETPSSARECCWSPWLVKRGGRLIEIQYANEMYDILGSASDFSSRPIKINSLHLLLTHSVIQFPSGGGAGDVGGVVSSHDHSLGGAFQLFW